jgi:hypothetical protein
LETSSQLIAELAEIKTLIRIALDRLEKGDNRFHEIEKRVNTLEHARTQILTIGSLLMIVVSAGVSAVMRMLMP